MRYGIILVLIFHSTFAYKNYTGYTLLRSMPLNRNHVDFLQNIAQEIKIDFWRPPGAVNKPVDMLVAPEEKERLIQSLEAKGYYYTTVMKDVQRAFDEQTIKPYIRRKMSSFDFKNFFQLGDIYNWLIDLSNEKPEEVEIIKLGETYENRHILAVKVVLKRSKLRSTVVVEGGIHAREWISPAFVCYMIDQVVNSEQSNDMEMKKLASTYEWYFVPVLNPDGYVYTFEHDRLWRKNRRSGYGVDINRNFDSAFGSIGVSKHTTDETFCGSFAFSEKESFAMKELVDKVHGHIEYYIAFHSYGQYIILPYAHLRTHNDNYVEMIELLTDVRKKIAMRYGTNYTAGTAFDTVGYTTSGVSGCWIKGTYRVPYVTTFELRDSGVHGFALPPNQILPTCEETLDGLKLILAPKTKQFIKLHESDRIGNRQSRLFTDFVLGVFAIILFVINNFGLIIIN